MADENESIASLKSRRSVRGRRTATSKSAMEAQQKDESNILLEAMGIKSCLGDFVNFGKEISKDPRTVEEDKINVDKKSYSTKNAAVSVSGETQATTDSDTTYRHGDHEKGNGKDVTYCGLSSIHETADALSIAKSNPPPPAVVFEQAKSRKSKSPRNLRNPYDLDEDISEPTRESRTRIKPRRQAVPPKEKHNQPAFSTLVSSCSNASSIFEDSQQTQSSSDTISATSYSETPNGVEAQMIKSGNLLDDPNEPSPQLYKSSKRLDTRSAVLKRAEMQKWTKQFSPARSQPSSSSKKKETAPSKAGDGRRQPGELSTMKDFVSFSEQGNNLKASLKTTPSYNQGHDDSSRVPASNNKYFPEEFQLRGYVRAEDVTPIRTNVRGSAPRSSAVVDPHPSLMSPKEDLPIEDEYVLTKTDNKPSIGSKIKRSMSPKSFRNMTLNLASYSQPQDARSSGSHFPTKNSSSHLPDKTQSKTLRKHRIAQNKTTASREIIGGVSVISRPPARIRNRQALQPLRGDREETSLKQEEEKSFSPATIDEHPMDESCFNNEEPPNFEDYSNLDKDTKKSAVQNNDEENSLSAKDDFSVSNSAASGGSNNSRLMSMMKRLLQEDRQKRNPMVNATKYSSESKPYVFPPEGFENDPSFDEFSTPIKATKKAPSTPLTDSTVDSSSFLTTPPRITIRQLPGSASSTQSFKNLNFEHVSSQQIQSPAATEASAADEEVQQWLLAKCSYLHGDDVKAYALSLVELGFDSYQILESGALQPEDLHFMKLAHRRALISAMKTNN